MKTEKKILIVSADAQWRESLKLNLSMDFENPTFYEASSGPEALAKITNAAPSIVILEFGIAKMKTEDFVYQLKNLKTAAQTAVIIHGPFQNIGELMDEAVRGRVHFINSIERGVELSKAVNNALNFSFSGTSTDYKVKMLSQNETLIKEGDAGNCVYVLKTGKLKVHLERDGEQKFLGYIEPGEIVGEMSYVNESPRSATVVAITNSELVEIPNLKMDQLLFKKPAWAKSLLRSLSNKLRTTIQRAS